MIPWLHHIITITITIIQTHNTPLLAHFLHPLLWVQSTTALNLFFELVLTPCISHTSVLGIYLWPSKHKQWREKVDMRQTFQYLRLVLLKQQPSLICCMCPLYVCSTIGAGIWESIVLLNSGLASCFTNDNRPNTSGLSVSKNHQETRTIYFEKLFVSSQGTWVNTPLLRYIMVKVKMNLVSA